MKALQIVLLFTIVPLSTIRAKYLRRSAATAERAAAKVLLINSFMQHRKKDSPDDPFPEEKSSFLNTLINNMPFEMHVPGYHYCGAGTKLQKRFKEGDMGINPLDAACRLHDIVYTQFTSLDRRHIADLELISAAVRRFRESQNISERLIAFGIIEVLQNKLKHSLRMGVNRVT